MQPFSTMRARVAEAAVPRQSILWPYLALLLGVFGVGVTPIFIVWANAPGAVSGLYRMAIAAAVMAAPFGFEVRRGGPLSRRHLAWAALAGFVFALDLFVWNTSLLMTAATSAALLGSTSPLWVGIGAVLWLKERLRPAFWGGVCLIMVGAVFIVGLDFLVHPTFGLGDLLALSGGLFYAAFFLVTQRSREGASALATWWVSTAVCATVLLLLSLLLQQPLGGYPASTYWSLLGIALFSQVGGWLALNYALGHLPASLVSPTLVAQPVITALLSMPLLGQPVTAWQLFGGAVIVAGILIVHSTREAQKG